VTSVAILPLAFAAAVGYCIDWARFGRQDCRTLWQGRVLRTFVLALVLVFALAFLLVFLLVFYLALALVFTIVQQRLTLKNSGA